MKYRYIKPAIMLTAISCGCFLSGSGSQSTDRLGTVGSDGNAFQDDFNDGNESGITDVVDNGPSSSAKQNSFWDEY